MSFVVRGELNQSSWELAVDEAPAVAPVFSAAGAVTAAGEAAAGGGGLRLWREVNAAFPVSLDDMVSGPEDPRVLRLDDDLPRERPVTGLATCSSTMIFSST